MSHHDDRRPTIEYAREHSHDRITVGRVEVSCRFVGEDQLGMSDQSAGNGDALLLAARELPRHVTGAMGEVDSLESCGHPLTALGA